MSERLGHATVSFILDVYSHAIKGLQEDAAEAGRRFDLWGAGYMLSTGGPLTQKTQATIEQTFALVTCAFASCRGRI